MQIKLLSTVNVFCALRCFTVRPKKQLIIINFNQKFSPNKNTFKLLTCFPLFLILRLGILLFILVSIEAKYIRWTTWYWQVVFFFPVILGKVPCIQNSKRKIVAVSKHLCGAATGKVANSVIDQTWGQDGWVLAKFSFAFVWIATKLRYIKTNKERGQFPAIITEQAWSIKDLYNYYKAKRLHQSGQSRAGKIKLILPACVANQNAVFT